MSQLVMSKMSLEMILEMNLKGLSEELVTN